MQQRSYSGNAIDDCSLGEVSKSEDQLGRVGGSGGDFVGVKVATDAPFLLTGTEPEPEDFESRYVAHPWLAYLHITPGVLYLLGAPLQLSQRIRTKHYTLHRRLGRVLVTAALVSVLFAFLFGLRFPWGGSVEAVATAVFGCWFLTCLLLAFRGIRRDDVVNHRRWMIRAFAGGVAVGTIRIWIGILLASGLLNFPDSFAAAFWNTTVRDDSNAANFMAISPLPFPSRSTAHLDPKFRPPVSRHFKRPPDVHSARGPVSDLWGAKLRHGPVLSELRLAVGPGRRS